MFAVLLGLAVGMAALPGAALAQEDTWEEVMIAATKSLQQNDYAGAETHLRAALAIAERFDTTDPRLGRTLSNLAYIYRLEGRLTLAEPLYRRTLVLWETMLGPNHLDVATALNNLAGLYHLLGQYDAAEAGFLRSLAIRQKTLGAHHPDVATSLYYLSRLYRTQKRLQEAGEFLERSVAIWESILGPANVKVASNLYDLARLYRAQSRFDEAERIEGRIRAIWAYRAQQPRTN
jgi:tetratricopeptide (TPR) repeat protein